MDLFTTNSNFPQFKIIFAKTIFVSGLFTPILQVRQQLKIPNSKYPRITVFQVSSVVCVLHLDQIGSDFWVIGTARF